MFTKGNIRKNFLRVKQTADQKLGRSEKTELLSDDLQSSEKKVELVKQVSTNTGKKVQTSLLGTGTSDVEKRLKKMPEAGIAHCMIEAATVLGTEDVMGQMYQLCGDCQNSLAKNHLDYELDVEKQVLEPIQNIIDNEIPHITKLKKALTKLALDMDSAKNRWHNAVRQTHVPGVNMATAASKADSVKEELGEAEARVEGAKDAYTTGLFSFISKGTEHSQNLLTLLEAQAKYHAQALDIINKVIPKMNETLNCSPIKPVYGLPLEEHLRVTNRDIAQVLEACICYLLETGLEEEGLFRIAGMASKVKRLKASFDAGVDFDETGELDPHTVAGALKQYLRELPEPLLTFQLFPEFMAAAQLPADQRLQQLWIVVDKLPKPNYDNFRYLIKFLSKLSEKSEVNKMTPGNIAIVIGPNLIWSEGDNGPNMMNTSILSLITELIVQHADWFFPGDQDFHATMRDCAPEHKRVQRTSSQVTTKFAQVQEVQQTTSGQQTQQTLKQMQQVYQMQQQQRSQTLQSQQGGQVTQNSQQMQVQKGQQIQSVQQTTQQTSQGQGQTQLTEQSKQEVSQSQHISQQVNQSLQQTQKLLQTSHHINKKAHIKKSQIKVIHETEENQQILKQIHEKESQQTHQIQQTSQTQQIGQQIQTTSQIQEMGQTKQIQQTSHMKQVNQQEMTSSSSQQGLGIHRGRSQSATGQACTAGFNMVMPTLTRRQSSQDSASSSSDSMSISDISLQMKEYEEADTLERRDSVDHYLTARGDLSQSFSMQISSSGTPSIQKRSNPVITFDPSERYKFNKKGSSKKSPAPSPKPKAGSVPPPDINERVTVLPSSPSVQNVHSDMYNTAFALQSLGDSGTWPTYLNQVRTMWDDKLGKSGAPEPNLMTSSDYDGAVFQSQGQYQGQSPGQGHSEGQERSQSRRQSQNNPEYLGGVFQNLEQFQGHLQGQGRQQGQVGGQGQLRSDREENFYIGQGNGSPLGRSAEPEEHRTVERTNSDQSNSSVKMSQQSSPVTKPEPKHESKPEPKQEPMNLYPNLQAQPVSTQPAQPVSPLLAQQSAGSRSPSVSPAASNTNLTNAPIAESEDLPVVVRRQPRKPAPPPPERPFSVAGTMNIRAGQAAQYQTWPRQTAPLAEDVDSADTALNNEQAKLERPAPPERVSSLPHHVDRPKIPPPVVPPTHKRSASTGAPVVIPGGQLNTVNSESATGSASYLQANESVEHNHNHQLTASTDKPSPSSLTKPSVSRPPRPMPPPPPPPETSIVEQTHL